MNELYSLMSVNDYDLLEKTKKRRRDDFFCCYCLLMVESLSDNVTKNNWIYDSRLCLFQTNRELSTAFCELLYKKSPAFI